MESLKIKIKMLTIEKQSIIRDFIDLKGENQLMYYQLQEMSSEIEQLKAEITKIKEEKAKVENEFASWKKDHTENIEGDHDESIIFHENKVLHAKLKQLQRNSLANTTASPQKSESEQEYEVEKLVKHRKRKGKRQFLVRWKNFTSDSDTWQNEDDLNCPAVLKQYLKDNKL